MASPDVRKKTILVAEDDDISREGFTLVLRQAGFQVVPAANGKEALDLLRAGTTLDLILLDMLMPVVDGWKFLEELRSEAKASIPIIIVVTGTILTHEWAESQGCTGFLKKPVEEEELLREVQRCLGQA